MATLALKIFDHAKSSLDHHARKIRYESSDYLLFVGSFVIANKFLSNVDSCDLYNLDFFSDERISHRVYSHEDLVSSEKRVLQILDWKILYAIPQDYIQDFFDHLIENSYDETLVEKCECLRKSSLNRARSTIFDTKNTKYTAKRLAVKSINNVINSSQISKEVYEHIKKNLINWQSLEKPIFFSILCSETAYQEWFEDIECPTCFSIPIFSFFASKPLKKAAPKYVDFGRSGLINRPLPRRFIY